MNSKKETVFVGLSGGVDSSVSARRLIDQGFNVVGVFIKTWQPDFLVCNWEKERLDAMRVAAHLGIPFYTCDAEEAYKHNVAGYMIREYTEGRTPNPDVMCNQYVKFGIFMKYALLNGATKIATGHYAQVKEGSDRLFHLYRGADENKDQSYFLWTLTQEQLTKTLFPVGDSPKPQIRIEAERYSLPTYAKSDSQGICFLGEIDIKEFLSHYVTVEVGAVLNEAGERIGTHEGALYYTLGQRHGFTVTTAGALSTPHYIIAKDITQNTLTVSPRPRQVQGERFVLSTAHAILGTFPPICEAQFRYRQKPFQVSVQSDTDGRVMLTVLDNDIEVPSVGQSCVLYNGTECLGGGVIHEII